MITEHDERGHRPGTEPHWQESFYFNWSELDGGGFGLTRIGFNEGGTRGDGLVLTTRNGVPEALYPAIGVEVDTSDGTSVGDLTYTMIEPLRKWRITLDGDATMKLDLVWEAFTPVYDFAAGGTPGDLAHAHFEQCGTVTGTIEIDGVAREVNALGHRDKSWGPRDWSGTEGWEWLAGQFGPDLAFNVSIVSSGDGPVINGFIFRNGTSTALEAASVAYDWDGIEHVPASAIITFTDVNGEAYEITADAVGQVSLAKGELFIQESPARFSIDLDGTTRTGLGVLEHTWHAGIDGIVARMDQLAPVLALAEAAQK